MKALTIDEWNFITTLLEEELSTPTAFRIENFPTIDIKSLRDRCELNWDETLRKEEPK